MGGHRDVRRVVAMNPRPTGSARPGIPVNEARCVGWYRKLSFPSLSPLQALFKTPSHVLSIALVFLIKSGEAHSQSPISARGLVRGHVAHAVSFACGASVLFLAECAT